MIEIEWGGMENNWEISILSIFEKFLVERVFAFEDLVEYYIAEHGLSPPVSGFPQRGGD